MNENPHKREWRDLRNWRGGWLGIYVAPQDPRIWVPKLSGMGWTLNFAHRASWWWLALLLAGPIVLVLLLWFFVRGRS